MKRVLLFVGTAVALAGCVVESPPPVNRYYSPPPPKRVSQHHPLSPTGAQANSRAEDVKPLGKGLLTALTVGNYMDDQEKELRASLRGTGVVISRVGDDLVIHIGAQTLFAGKSAELSGKGETIVLVVAHSVRRFDSTTLSIHGYTDTASTSEGDLKALQLRAEAIDEALANGGVDAHRIAARGFGAEKLRFATGPNVSEPRNRRIEIDIAPRLKS